MEAVRRAEACAILGVTNMSLWRFVKRGIIKRPDDRFNLAAEYQLSQSHLETICSPKNSGAA
jgi:hypothetical protein